MRINGNLKYDDVDRPLLKSLQMQLYTNHIWTPQILNHLNSMILKGGDISDEDYEFFEKVKGALFRG